jgi:hypothetical protein
LNPYRYRVSLRITHPSADLDYLDAALAMKAPWRWRAGDPRETPEGVPLKGYHQYSYWCVALTGNDAMDTDLESLESFLATQLDRLGAYADVLADLTGSNGKASLFIGLFIDGDSSVSISPAVAAKAAANGIALDFDIYPPDEQNEILL